MVVYGEVQMFFRPSHLERKELDLVGLSCGVRLLMVKRGLSGLFEVSLITLSGFLS